MLFDASVTSSLVNFATHAVQHLGYAGVVLMVTMSQLIIVPGTEPTMLFAGFNVDTHHLTLVGIILAGILGDVLGASIAYAIGYFGLHEVLAARGPLHVDQRKIERAHAWFDRYGAPSIAVSRLIPVFRSAPPYAAGIVRMPYLKFLTFATLGSTVWMIGLGVLGKEVGSQWPQWKNHLDIVDYVVVALIVVAIVWWLVRLVRSRRRPQAPSTRLGSADE
ncbi:MAG TPA: DedA family protein [Solirubrobacteraceae bacterium]